MDFGCCTTENARNIDGTASGDEMNSMLTYSDSQDSFDSKANTLNCDYKDAPKLFKAIEEENWKGILLFLTTGRWGNSALASTFTHMQDQPPERQVRMWVSCRDKNGELLWRQLPIHAAISYSAPLPVIQKIVEMHHGGVRSADDTGNLPLHLAFGFGSPDNVVAFLIREFPQALSVRGLQSRRPVDCCELAANKARGEIIRACQAYTKSSMMKEWDHHWKQSFAEASKKAGLKEPYLTKNKTIDDVFSEFMRVKLELEKAKLNANNRPTMIITKTGPAVPLGPRSLGRSPSGASGIFSFASRRGGGSRAGGSRAGKKKFFPSVRASPSAPVAPIPPLVPKACPSPAANSLSQNGSKKYDL